VSLPVVTFNALNIRPGIADGAATYAVNVLAELPAALPEARIVAYVRPGENRIPTAPNLELRRVAWTTAPGGRLLADAVLLSAELRRLGAAAHVAPYESLPVAVRCPIVVVAQNLVYHYPAFDAYRGARLVERLTTRVQAAYYRRRMASAYAQAAAVAAVSEHAATVLAEQEGLDRSRTTVVHEGSDSRLLSPPRPPRARTSRLLVVSTLAPYKNVERAVDALAVARPLVEGDLRLEVVGSGWRGYDAVVREHVLRSSAAGAVVLRGPVVGSQLVELYESSLALVHLSECESFGLPPLEAMRYGLPVIAADRSALPEVTGGAAVLVDPHDPGAVGRQIARLASSPALRERLAERGYAVAAAKTWAATAQGLASVVRSVAPQLSDGVASPVDAARSAIAGG
jgi:glycosyltransferase involved in cell wall biosynthesis